MKLGPQGTVYFCNVPALKSALVHSERKLANGVNAQQARRGDSVRQVQFKAFAPELWAKWLREGTPTYDKEPGAI